MSIYQAGSVLRHLRQAALRHDGAGMSDGQLLRSFLNRRDEAAFEALVRRHGPMVRGVCRRVLRNADDADDAFQAVFLVLVRKAAALASREVVGDWLHGVAYRTALKARAADSRRRVKESQTPQREATDEEARAEWHALLDQEVGRLPEKYRLPVVLCDMEGRTRKAAARQLGWPEGTLSGRLARARAILARRLTRRGITLSADALMVALTQEAAARLPVSLVGSTFRAATVFAAGQATGAVSAKVAALTEGVVKAMWMSKLKSITVLMSATLALAVGVGAWRHHVAAAGEAANPRDEELVLIARDRKADAPKIATMPAAHCSFKVELHIERIKDGQRTLLATQTLGSVDGLSGSSKSGRTHVVDLGNGQVETLVVGVDVKVAVRAIKGDKIRLDMTASYSNTLVAVGDDVAVTTESVRLIRNCRLGQAISSDLKVAKDSSFVVTAVVHQVEKETNRNTIERAEKAFKMAEFYRRTGHPDSAQFYYELIGKRYPDTICAERAKERITELKEQRDKAAKAKEKKPARIGQIFIIGNKKIGQELIMKLVPLYPGEILKDSEIRAAERNLSKIRHYCRSDPKITVIEPDDGGIYKDIAITVEEQ